MTANQSSGKIPLPDDLPHLMQFDHMSGDKSVSSVFIELNVAIFILLDLNVVYRKLKSLTILAVLPTSYL